jgi:hypothetical protein
VFLSASAYPEPCSPAHDIALGPNQFGGRNYLARRLVSKEGYFGFVSPCNYMLGSVWACAQNSFRKGLPEVEVALLVIILEPRMFL